MAILHLRPLLWACCCLLWAAPQFLIAQPFPPDTNGAHDPLVVAVGFNSFEDTDWDESTSLTLGLKCVEKTHFKGHFIVNDNPWFPLLGNDSLLLDTVLNPGDSLPLTWNFTYDTTDLPFYAKEVGWRFAPDTSVPDSTRPQAFKQRLMVFFTPYRTLELWNLKDYHNLHRVWLHGAESSAMPWAYLHPDSIPDSDIPDDTVTRPKKSLQVIV